MRSARIEAVCVVHELRPGFFHDTAIDKRPVEGPVEVTSAGLVGDRQMDRTHGGPDKAIYAYASEDADWWAQSSGSPFLRACSVRTSACAGSTCRVP